MGVVRGIPLARPHLYLSLYDYFSISFSTPLSLGTVQLLPQRAVSLRLEGCTTEKGIKKCRKERLSVGIQIVPI